MTQKTKLTLENTQKVKNILQKNRPDPKNRDTMIGEKQKKSLTLSESDLNLLMGYGLSKEMGLTHVAARVKLSPNFLIANASVKIPGSFLGNYINITAMVKGKKDFLKLHSITMGRITLPEPVVSPLLAGIHRLLMRFEPYEKLFQNRQNIQQVTIAEGVLKLSYEWDLQDARNLKTQIQKNLIPLEHQPRLVRHHNELAMLLRGVQGRPTSLATLLPPMFAFAESQSEISNISWDPVQENKALFQVLALYVTGHRLANLVTPKYRKEILPFRPARILLRKREDLVKHFLVSAALTVSASSRLANFMGIAKEMDDSTNGSGFSFADLAADKAGVKMGELAIAGQDQARKLQQEMQLDPREDAFMPEINNLPEGIMALEFNTRYQDLDSKAYNLINSEIETRLKNCTLYGN
ncbi:MAG: hypothetical protein KAH09_01135 [Desulfobacula sp.]|nr:hypothetical protein [Desulfobacula sp.]